MLFRSKELEVLQKQSDSETKNFNKGVEMAIKQQDMENKMRGKGVQENTIVQSQLSFMSLGLSKTEIAVTKTGRGRQYEINIDNKQY